MKKIILVLLLTLLVVPTVTLASGLSSGSAEENIFIPQEQVITHSYFAVGNTIDISGTLENDAYVVGQSVVVGGVIKGDLIGAANSLRIDGVVEGNIRFAASEIIIKGQVYKNVTVASGNVVILGQLNQDLIVAAGIIDLQGEILGDVNLYGGKVNVTQPVAGNLVIHVDENGTLEFGEGVTVGGDLEYSPTKEAIVGLDSVLVSGETKVLEAKKGMDFNKALDYVYIYSRIAYFLALLIIALVLLSFMKKFTLKVSATLIKEPLKCFNRGFWFVMLTPLVCLVLLFTLIGMPLAGIIIALYAVVFYVSKVFIGIAVGMTLLKKDIHKEKLFWPAVLGIFLVVVGVSVPFLGFLVNLLITSAGFGALYMVLKGEVK